MLVYTDDVRKLVGEVISKYEKDSGMALGMPNMKEFFEGLMKEVNRSVNSKLNAETLYKHYHIRLKTLSEQEVGYSINYLNALCQFAYGIDYLDQFPRVEEELEEIPEFPTDHPSFPATPAIKIEYGGFSNLWIKDESQNPTGVHKDRKSHEIYLFYNRELAKQFASNTRVKIQRLSIISAGYAALSIQYMLQKSGFASLKVLIDSQTPEFIKEMLRNSRAEIYETNLAEKKLDELKILELTDNPGGIELTYGSKVQEAVLSFYDWLAYETLNLNPDYLFIPYGSGELFRNILEIHIKELKSKNNSKRYFGNRDILRKCNFVGARNSKSRGSRMFCLSSDFDSQDASEIDNILNSKYCGKESGIFNITEDKEGEERMDRAIQVLKEHNIRSCESGASGLTLLMELVEKEKLTIDKKAKIVIINTGKIRPELFTQSTKK